MTNGKYVIDDPLDNGYNARITRLEQKLPNSEMLNTLKLLEEKYDNASERIANLARAMTEANRRIGDLQLRTYAMEKKTFSSAAVDLRSQAAQCEATEHLYAPLRSDTSALLKLAELARRLLDPQDLGHAVTFEVRELAREALGKEKVG